MKVLQIECYSRFKAPTDCYQYFTGVTQTGIQSINYPNVMLTDQLYEICVRQEFGYCGIEWMQNPTNSPDSFELHTTDDDGLVVRFFTILTFLSNIPTIFELFKFPAIFIFIL